MLEKWCSNYLLDERQNQKENFVPFIVQIFSLPKNNWLVSLIRENISFFLSDINVVTAKTIWLWIAKDVSVVKSVSDEIENSRAAEKNLCDSLPKTEEAVLSEVKKFASKRNWLRLYATILNSQFDFETALAEQLKVDTDKNSFDGIEIISQRAKPKEIITTSVAIDDKRCIFLSGKLCKADPKLLADMQIENANWQEVWLAGINNGNKLTDGLNEPMKIIHLFFDLMINGKSVNESLLERISETDFANILDYANRNKIWAKISPKVKQEFLEKTSSALLQSVSDNSTFQIPIDKDLSDYIISSNAIGTFLYYNRSNIKAALPIFNTYSQLPEHILRDYISNYSGKFGVVDATQLGQLTYKRRYSKVAYSIYQKAYSSKQFKIALAECLDLLDFITRGLAWAAGLISKIEVSEDEWWAAFTQLSYTLYDEGPIQNKIWTQADGKGYDLETKGSGKEVWIIALQKLRKKNCAGDISVKKLLKAMHEENKKNEELKTLKDLWNKI